MTQVARWTIGVSIGLTVAALSLACQGPQSEPPGATSEGESQSTPATEEGEVAQVNHDRATAPLAAKSGSDLSGEAYFVEEDGGQIAFGVNVENLSPGKHAVHIHEDGDCSAEDAASAGGHWNPMGKEHGKWGMEPFHLGDIGNIDVGENGQGTLSLTTDLWTLGEPGEDDHSVIGKSVIVHAGADDFTTQPDGGAGDRIGCGVIAWKEQT